MSESYSVEAILSVVDQGFSQAMKRAEVNTQALEKTSQTSSMSLGSMAKAFGIAQVAASAFTSVVGLVTSGIGSMITELNDSSKAWQTFEANMQMIGKSEGEIQKVQASLQEFATQTIYSASDMAQTYSQMAAIGVADTEKLVKGMGGLAASAENPAQAMKSLSQQMTQALAKPQLQWMDFRIMMEQAPAAMAAVAEHMGYSLDEFVVAIQDGEIASKDFAAAVAEVGTNEHFSKMATEAKTVDQALDGLRETVANKLMPVFQQASDGLIEIINNIADWVGELDIEGIVDNVVNVAKGIGQFIATFTAPLRALIGLFGNVGDAAQGANKAIEGVTGRNIREVAVDVEKLASEWSEMTLEEKQATVSTMGQEQIEELMQLLGVDFENLPDEYSKTAYANAHGKEGLEELLFLTGEWGNLTLEEKRAVLEAQIENDEIAQAIDTRDLWNNEEFYTQLAEINMNDNDAEQQIVDLINEWAELEGLEPVEITASATDVEETTDAVSNLGSVMETVGAIAGTVVSGIVAFGATISVINGVTNAVAGLRVGFMRLIAGLAANPFALAVGAIVAVGVALYYAYQSSETFRKAFDGVVDSVKNSKVFKDIEKAIENFKETLADIDWEGALNKGIELFDDIWETVQTVFTNIGNFISPVINGIGGVIETGINMWSGLFKAFGQALNGDWRGAWETVKTTFQTTWDSLIEIAGDVATQMWQNIQSAFESGAEFLSNFGSTLKEWIFTSTQSQSWADVGQFVIDGIVGGLTWLGNGAVSLIDIGSEILTWITTQIESINWESIGTTIGTFLGDAINMGIDLLSGNGTGTSSLGSWFNNTLAPAVEGFIGNLGTTIQTAFAALDVVAVAALEGLFATLTGSSWDEFEGQWQTAVNSLSEVEFTGDFGQLVEDVKAAINTGFEDFVWSDLLPPFEWDTWEEDFAALEEFFGLKEKSIQDFFSFDWLVIDISINWDWIADIKLKLGNFVTWLEEQAGKIVDLWNKITGAGSEVDNSHRGGNARASSGLYDIPLGGGVEKFPDTGKKTAPGSIHFEAIQIDTEPIIAQVRAMMEQIKLTIAEGQVGVQNQFRTLFTNLTPTFEEAKMSLATTMRSLMEQMKLTIAEGQIGLQNQFRVLFTSLTPIFEEVKLSLAMQMRMMMEQLKLTIAEGQVGLQNQFRVLFTSLNPTFETAKTTMATHMRSYMEQMKSTIASYQGGIVNQMQAIFNALPPIYAKGSSDATRGARQIMEALKSGIASYQQGVVNQVRSVVSAAASAITGYTGQFRSAGVSLGQGLYNGLASMRGSIVSLASSIASSAASTIRQGLDINSPSGVGIWLFKMLGKGLYIGLESFVKPLQRLYETITDIFVFEPRTINMDLTPNVNQSQLDTMTAQGQLNNQRVSSTNQFTFDTTNIEHKLDELIAKRMDLYIDRDTWVGGTLDDYDHGLGQNYESLEGRLLI